VPDVILPKSILSVLRRLRPVFTAPSFANFVVLVAGFVHALGGHRITDVIRAAGPAVTKHYTTYYRFFSRARWSIDELGCALLAIIVEAFDAPTIELVLDDTLCHRSGKKVALAGMHADPALKKTTRGRLFSSYGHVFVVLAVHVKLPALASTGWALPVLFRLFEAKKQGGKKDSPSDKRRELERRRAKKKKRNRIRKTDREAVDGKLRPCPAKPDEGPFADELYRKKTELGAELILLVARKFPMLKFRVLADHLYNGKTVLHAVLSEVDNVHVVTRGRKDAALYKMPPERKPGQKGRPRVKGDRLLNPEEWSQANPSEFTTQTVEMYGRQVEVEVASYLGMAYISLPGRLLRYVIVRDPAGIYRTDYIISTNTELSIPEILSAYSRRWPLERTFQDCKQKLRIETPQIQLPMSVRRVVPFGMLVYSIVVLWYLTDGRTEAADLAPRLSDPWYEKTSRPSFTDMLAALRRVAWGKRLLDPPSTGPPGPKVWADYAARVVAAA